MPLPEEPLANIRIYLTFLETESHVYILPLIVWVYRRWIFFSAVGSVKPFLFLQEWRFGRSRSSKVIDFGTNLKRVCDFLLVVLHSNLGPVLHRFEDIAGFCAPDPPLFHPIFEVFPLHQIAHVRVSSSVSLKLISREIIFEVFQSMWSWSTNVADRQTDGRHALARPRFALHAR